LTVTANIKSHSFKDCSAQTTSLFELDIQIFAIFCQFRRNWQTGSMLQFIINGGVWVDAVVKVQEFDIDFGCCTCYLSFDGECWTEPVS